MNTNTIVALACAAFFAAAGSTQARETEELGSTSQPIKIGPSGNKPAPDRCKQGYVWREARPADHVCVPAQTRSEVAQQNRSARERWVQGAYGPHTCIQGYVWREAYAGDKVCVTPEFRARTHEDNRLARQRRVGG